MKNRTLSGEKPEPTGTQTGNNRGFLDYIRIFWTHFWQLAFLNIVFCLACLPVVTIPAALAGMNRACIKLVQEGYVLVWLEFRDAFRKEFGKSLGLGVLFGGLLAGSYYLLSLGLSNGGNPYGLLFSGGGLCLLAIAVLWGQYSFVLLASLDLPLGAILRNGWSLAFLGAPSSLGILVLEAAGVLFLVMLSPISLGIALFFGVAFVHYTICFLVNFPLQKWILEPFRRSRQESKP